MVVEEEKKTPENDIKKFTAQSAYTVFHEMPEEFAKVQFAFYICQRRNTFEGKIDALQGLARFSASLRDMADEIFKKASDLSKE